MKDVPIAEEWAGQRLDVVVVQLLPHLSRAFVQKLCEREEIQINDKPAKPSYKVRTDDKLTVLYDPDAPEPTLPIDLPILYEDSDVMVINKPTGVLTHSKGVFNPESTVATFIKDKLDGLEGERAGIVHRLDRATSGVIICAKNKAALSWLQKQFSQRKVKKTYIAVVAGNLPNEQAIIDMPIERNPKKPQTFRTGASGKPAVTEYKVLTSNGEYTLLELKPLTGRTHQLRVHLAKLGHPIVGDTLYGGKSYARLLLHALKLEITLPNRERKTFEAAEPPEFEEIMQ